MAIAFYSKVVDTSAYTEETLFTPMRTPRVSYSPEWLTILNTITNNRDSVDNLRVTSCIAIDATSVILEGLWDCNTACNWSALINFLQHVLLTRNISKFINVVYSILWWDNASLAWAAVSADFHSRAFLSIIVSKSLINRASLISNFVSLHPTESSQR